MKVPRGIKEIWIDCKDNTNYFSRIEGDRLIILTYIRKFRTNENETGQTREQR